MNIDFKLACDTQISKRAVQELTEAGIEVVYRANDEQDEVWIEAALRNGANVFISPDLDIPNYLDRMDINASWIDIPRGVDSRMQSGYIFKQLMRLVKNRLAGEPEYKILEIGKKKYLVQNKNVDAFLRCTRQADRETVSVCVMIGNSVNWRKDGA